MFERFRPKPPKPTRRAVHLYLAREGEAAIVARLDEWGGLWCERPGGAELLTAPDLPTLGAAVKRAFADFGHREEPLDLRGQKKSDWAAYQASGLRTMKAFERDFTAYIVQGANTANIIMEALSPALSNGIALTASIDALAKDEEVGRWLRDLHAFFLSVERSLDAREP